MKLTAKYLLFLITFVITGCTSLHYYPVKSKPFAEMEQTTANLRYIETITLSFADREVVLYSELMLLASSKYPHKIIIDNVRYQYVVTNYFGFLSTKRIREVVVDVYRSNI
jgi:hypothetical protein